MKNIPITNQQRRIMFDGYHRWMLGRRQILSTEIQAGIELRKGQPEEKVIQELYDYAIKEFGDSAQGCTKDICTRGSNIYEPLMYLVGGAWFQTDKWKEGEISSRDTQDHALYVSELFYGWIILENRDCDNPRSMEYMIKERIGDDVLNPGYRIGDDDVLTTPEYRMVSLVTSFNGEIFSITPDKDLFDGYDLVSAFVYYVPVEGNGHIWCITKTRDENRWIIYDNEEAVKTYSGTFDEALVRSSTLIYREHPEVDIDYIMIYKQT